MEGIKLPFVLQDSICVKHIKSNLKTGSLDMSLGLYAGVHVEL